MHDDIDHANRVLGIGLVFGGGLIVGAVLDQLYGGLVEAIATGSLIIAAVMTLVYVKDIWQTKSGVKSRK